MAAVLVTRVTTIIGISFRNMVIASNLIVPSFLFYFAIIINVILDKGVNSYDTI